MDGVYTLHVYALKKKKKDLDFDGGLEGYAFL